MGNLNVRYSFNIKNSDTERQPLNYDMGFTMVGKVPYDYAGMEQFKAKRRHPKAFVHIQHSSALAMANSYPALETGFSWDEWGDSTLGAGSRPVWEGVFWIWERHILFNTGGPTRKWNMRREYDGTPSRERKLYYSEVDKRIHLLNAGEAGRRWATSSAPRRSPKSGRSIRNGDGYFDRWEYDLDNDGRPERTTTVRDSRARPVTFSYQELNRMFTREVLPAAILEDEKLIAEFKRFVKLDDHKAIQLEEWPSRPTFPSGDAISSTWYASITTRRSARKPVTSVTRIRWQSAPVRAGRGALRKGSPRRPGGNFPETSLCSTRVTATGTMSG